MPRAVVLSDLHLGPGGSLTIFRDHAPLEAFLKHLAEEAADTPTELILAGDVFDFLQSKDYEGFDAARAPERLTTILGASGNPGVIAALATFAATRNAEVTVLAGNHDPEMLLPETREVFERAIHRVGAVRWADDDAPLRPREGNRWPLWGRELGGDAGKVWITHGDRWDPHNALDRDAVRAAAAEGRRVELPKGSHLVFEVLGKIKPEQRWVDELKPELPLVLLLLYYLDARKTKAFVRQHWKLTGDLVRGGLLARLDRASVLGEEPGSRPALAFDVPEALTGLLAEGLGDVPAAEREGLIAELAGVIDGAEVRSSPDDLLADHTGVGKLLLRTWMAAIRKGSRFQAEDGPDDLPARAAPMLREDVVGLVAGHTHGPRWARNLRPVYVNTGTWIPVGALPAGDLPKVIDDLEKGMWSASAPRTFAVVELGDGPPTLRLGRCDARGAEIRQ